MKQLVKFGILFLVIAFTFFGCEKSNGIFTQQLSNADKELIQSEYAEMNDTISTVLLKDDCTTADFEQIIPAIQKYSSVEKAWVDGSVLFVKFKKGGTVGWIIHSEMIIPPYISELRSSTASEPMKASVSYNTPSNNMACLINQQYGDDSRPYCKEYISNLATFFGRSGYDVTIKNGQDANLNFFETELNKYGVIFCINHGGYDSENDVTWLLTGEEADAIGQLFERLSLWNIDKVNILSVKEERNGEMKIIPYYAISDRLLASEYKQNSFPNSVVYWVACQGMKSPKLGQTLQGKGVGATIGWDETNCLGQATGFLLFETLLGGENIQNAFQDLPAESKKDDCSIASGANLIYYPNSGGNMYLVAPQAASITIYSPVNGQTYENRVINLSGESNGFQRITNGTVEVNGITATLTLTSNTTFSQPIELNSGENHIKVNCYGVSENGEQTNASSELTVTGNFSNLALYTQLRWNTNLTDVDFHLLPPNSSISSLWSNIDCFYANKITSWGAYLDVDDVDGYGPEHITIPNTPVSGKYTLYVHYFSSHGVPTATDAYVSVATYNGNIVPFGPYRLTDSGGNNVGDVWEVCTIDYPSGIITPVEKYYNFSALRSSYHIPTK